MAPPIQNPREHPREHIGRGRPAWIAFALLLIAIVFSAQVRIRTALADPNFDAKDPRRLLWSDPALLYYFTERIEEEGGAALRADDHFQFPDRVDALAFETVGQEYVAAGWHRLQRAFGGADPLHLSCLESMAWSASLAAVGVFLLAAELTGSLLFGGFAALLFALLPANYRTIGILLLREDFALPWFALHLGLLARAARVRSLPSFVLCGLALLAALATWHAMGFVVALEAAVVFAWFLRTGANPFAVRGAWLVPAIVAGGSLLVPVLRAKCAALSLPMQAAIGLLAAAAFTRSRPQARGPASIVPRLVACAGALAAAFAAWALSRSLGGGIGDYSHVLTLMLAKVRLLGELPADPRALDFEARLLWQGPFDTGSVAILAQGLTVALPAMVWLGLRHVATWWRPKSAVGAVGEARGAWLAAFGLLTLASAWLVVRTTVVAGIVAPVALAAVVAQIKAVRWRVATGAAALVIAGGMMALFVGNHVIDWYGVALQRRDGRVDWVSHPRQRELPPLLAFLEKAVPTGEPIASDMVTSTAILAATRHPILLQPKYESRESRRRIGEFLDVFFRGTPADLADWLRRYRCRWFVLDTKTVGIGSLYLAGFKDDGSERPAEGSAAELFLGGADPARIAGFELLYRSPPELRTDMYRVYRIE